MLVVSVSGRMPVIISGSVPLESCLLSPFLFGTLVVMAAREFRDRKVAFYCSVC